MRSLRQIILDFLLNRHATYLSTVSLNYWLRVEGKREADKRKVVFPKRVKKNDQPTPIN